MTRRGDTIPTIADYAHWNEDAAAMWYAENKYDMEHWDEEVEDDYDDRRDYEPDPFQDVFDTKEAAQAFYDSLPDTPRYPPGEWAGQWYVEHYDTEAHRRHNA